MASQVADRAFLGPKWHSFCHLGNGMYIMVSNIAEGVQFGLLMIKSFPLLAPHHLAEVTKFNLEFPDPAQITETADKLRWYRYRKGRLQRNVADYAGIDRGTYTHYEEVGKDYYPVDKLGKIAELLDVEITELMDDYNLFLYHNQGKQIRARREALGMSVVQYAKHLGVQAGKLRRWENNQTQIFKSTWEKYFK